MTTVQWMSGADDATTQVGTADFDALFVAEYSRLVRSVGFVCGDAEVAADCVADAFERAYVRWRRVGRLDDPAGWIRRVAINRATDVARRRTTAWRTVTRLARRTATEPPAELQLSDSTAFHDSELAAAVAALSGRQRAVVALHYLDDLSVADVAHSLSLSEGAVKYHLHQARARLRSALGPDGDDATAAVSAVRTDDEGEAG